MGREVLVVTMSAFFSVIVSVVESSCVTVSSGGDVSAVLTTLSCTLDRMVLLFNAGSAGVAIPLISSVVLAE